MNELVLCVDGEPNFLRFFDLSLAPNLLYYSYISIIVVSLLLGVFVVVKDRFSKLSAILFSITLFFSIFILNELIQWIVIPAGVLFFTYALSLLLQLLILVATIYFVYVFIERKNPPFIATTVVAILALPIIIFLPTNLNLSGVELDTCSGLIGPLWNYFYLLELLTIVAFLIWSIVVYRKYHTALIERPLSSLFLLLGSAGFLTIFLASFFFADQTGIYEINLIGPLGMLIFIGTLSFLIVNYKIFRNVKVVAAQILVFILWLLLSSLVLIVKEPTPLLVIFITLVITAFVGYFLVRSVKKEVKLREEIQQLAQSLAQANERLKALDKQKSEFVSIASHQLRSPLTAVRGYASLLLEGNYGKVTSQMKEPLKRIEESSRLMSYAVEDYLNVSRIESGNMKYTFTDFNLCDQVERLCDDLRSDAIKRGLILLFRTDLRSRGVIHADLGKTVQVIQNLINNAIKYTEKGSIKVLVRDDVVRKILYVDIIDTGIGMNEKALANIFQKFGRADNAKTIDIHGTGLGLYVALMIAHAMGGNITAHSEGEGKGSCFTASFPLAL